MKICKTDIEQSRYEETLDKIQRLKNFFYPERKNLFRIRLREKRSIK